MLEASYSRTSKIPNVKIEAISSIYETDPVGYTDQANFLNMAVKISTSLSRNNYLSFV